MKTESILRFDEACEGVCRRIRGILLSLPETVKRKTYEIRMRTGGPVSLTTSDGVLFVTQAGTVTPLLREGMLKAAAADLEESFKLLCDFSVHAKQEQIKHSFVTLRGGHRAGIGGTAVVERGQLVSVRDIASINIRVARQVRGAADELVRRAFSGGVCSLLIAGAPSSGKTTLLRDLVRQLSDGKTGRYYKVAVIDERGEIAATCQGVPQNDLGPCCDVLDGYPKKEGILSAIRSLSPDVLILDELGGTDDARAVEEGIGAGVTVIATVHAKNRRDILLRPGVRRLVENGAFAKAVLLGGRETPGVIEDVWEMGEDDASACWIGGDSAREYGGRLADVG